MKRRAVVVFLLLLILLISNNLMAAVEESELNAEYWWDQFVKLVNVSLVIVVLYFVLRKPVRQFFKDRAYRIDENIRSAEDARTEAERELNEVKQQVAKLQEDIVEIKRKAKVEGEAEKARIIAAAEQDAQRILEGAKREIENLTRAGRLELKAYAAKLATDKARRLLQERLQDEDDRRLIERSLEEIKGAGLR